MAQCHAPRRSPFECRGGEARHLRWRSLCAGRIDQARYPFSIVARSMARAAYLAGTLLCGVPTASTNNLAANGYVFRGRRRLQARCRFCKHFGRDREVFGAHGMVVQVVMSYVLSFVVASYYPGCVLLHKSPLDLGATVFMALGADLVACVIWRRGLRRCRNACHWRVRAA